MEIGNTQIKEEFALQKMKEKVFVFVNVFARQYHVLRNCHNKDTKGLTGSNIKERPKEH